MANTRVTTPVTDFDKTNQTQGLKLPSGTNSSQPIGVDAIQGMLRNDTEETVDSSASTLTHYNGTQWKYFAATESPDPKHYNAVTYTGAGTTNPITGVGFQPDLIWLKRRNSASNHYIVDTVRGNGTSTYKNLSSNTTDTEGTTTGNGMKNDTIVDGGFTMQGAGARTNAIGSTYVAWCFKAGGAPSGSDKVSIDGTSYATMNAAGLTDGNRAINKLSVNTKLGFSIATIQNKVLNNGSNIAHGLGVPPELILAKKTDSIDNWIVFSKTEGGNRYLVLNSTSASADDTYWGDANPTSTLINFNWTSAAQDYVFYSFASKEGISKVDSYVGTGAAGNKVHTGFEPAFIMIKRSSTTGDWTIVDNKRPADKYLRANTDGAEATANNGIVFESDGFSFAGGSFNQSGQTAIYLAFA